jgi:cellobiose phosphorylase
LPFLIFEAIRHALRFGQHGLPLIGTGDWNERMYKVGNKGMGESVWLAFFLYDVLIRFTDTANAYGEHLFAEMCKTEAASLQSRIESVGWDGAWYKRAYFDDGTPLGSRENKECRIDAVSQSWAVLSGAASDQRAVMAMASLEEKLVRKDLKLIQLLVNVYKVEPYVMAADVYANVSHKGMGGWTWYTGSAGWMYQFILDSWIGLDRQADSLTFMPCFPTSWPSIQLTYRYGRSEYRITVFQLADDSPSWWKSDDLQGTGNTIKLADDGKIHSVEMHIRNRLQK